MIISRKNSGFTLIETIIYIALFSLLMGTAFVTAYQLIDGSNKLSVKNTTQEEGNFVLRKINWALTGVKTITTPSAGTTHNLTVTKYDSNQIDIKLVGTKIKMNDFLTTDNVTVSGLNFEYIAPLGSGPAGIIATATIDGVDFTITKYVRK